MSTTRTRQATQTSSYEKILRVTRRVQADLLAIVDTYSHWTESYALDVIHDLRIFLDEEAIDPIKFLWKKPGSKKVIDGFRYSIVTGSSLAADRAGGIAYSRELHLADFNVQVSYTKRWKEMTDSEKNGIRKRLRISWSPAGDSDYGSKRFKSDRTFSYEDWGLDRSRLN